METNNKIAGALIGLVLLSGVAIWGGIYVNQTPKPLFTSDNIGSTLGGRPFVITGDGFIPYGTTKVLVDGHPATEVRASSGHSIIAKAPAGTDGAKSVVVVNPNGKRATLDRGYIYSKYKPDIASVSPAVLPAQGGVLVTVKGTGFLQSPIDVKFHTSMVPFTIIDDTTLTLIAPPAPHKVPTNVNLEVNTKDGKWSSDEYGLNYR